MSIIYGRLSENELERRQGDPYVEVGNRRYRITELVHRLDGGANYQAKELTESEPEPTEVALPEVQPLVSVGGGVGVTHERPLPTMVTVAEVMDREVEPSPDPPLVEPQPFKAIVPPLNHWAKRHGWKGRGPIPSAVRRAYEEEFGSQA